MLKNLNESFQLLLGSTVLAATLSTGGEHLKKVLSFPAKNPTFCSEFTQVKKVKSLGFELPSKGHLEVLSPQHAAWIIASPAYLKADISPGEIRLFTDAKDTSKVQVFRLDGGVLNGGGSGWMSLLNFDEAAMDRNFVITEAAQSKFTLEPKQKNQAFKKIIAAISKLGFFETLSIEENSDDSIEIHFQAPQIGSDRCH